MIRATYTTLEQLHVNHLDNMLLDLDHVLFTIGFMDIQKLQINHPISKKFKSLIHRYLSDFGKIFTYLRIKYKLLRLAVKTLYNGSCLKDLSCKMIDY